MNKKDSQINIRLPTDLAKAARLAAKKQRKSLSAIVRDMLIGLANGGNKRKGGQEPK